ncbi:Wadjet anti-phage system protein JetD domain-containing protein [Rubinisphaera sp.]|uniref:Wadjet anti-phage system protein JetD domain-containing protein n=1 Tax=Rubinisphaera sp. TaxID=2024857 RepID=UPI000C0D164F|nr:Wadjet anti-phage system protein JetD domain-containing protein [Rubinisphaera sp.]MBV10595.1 hypothetical protein [Rubinisphaera sp.]HCS51825.1 hypothetical protein [Planctomycetaceae bacterium]|tara:strand:- start:2636 stop:3796 length:1161 start_codon:yes stop_codon:yes gene_type:complete
MINPNDIRLKANNLYAKLQLAWLDGEEFFPCRILGNRKLPDDPAAAIHAVQLLKSQSNAETGFGYSIEWRERNSQRHGKNLVPEKILFATQADYLRFIRKEEEFEKFTNAVAIIRQHYPELENWIRSNRKLLIDSADDIDGLILVVDFLRANPRPGLFARELPLSIDTKFIERNQRILRGWLDLLLPPTSIRADEQHFARRYGLQYDQPRLQIRFLDSRIQQAFGSPWPDCSIPLETLAKQNVDSVNVLVVENKTCLMTLPPLSNTIAMGGIGNAVADFRLIPWLHECNIWYWGDIDVDGLSILSRFRVHFPNAESILMDFKTLCRHRDHIGQRNETAQIPSPPINLTTSERSAFDVCHAVFLRIEQEQIPSTDVIQILKQLFSTA